MNVEFAAEDLAFQAEVKAFIDENLTPDMREVLQRSPTGHLSKTLQIEWQRASPKRLGRAELAGRVGRSQLDGHAEDILTSRCPRRALRACYLWGHHGGAGYHEVRLPGPKGAVPPRYSGVKVWWCQGYSERLRPDLASLGTTAKRDGDHYIVNGTKTWTTLGQHAT